MSNILTLNTFHWSLTVWTRDNATPLQKLTHVLKERCTEDGDELWLASKLSNELRLSSKHSGSIQFGDETSTTFESSNLLLSSPLCYENRDYEFEFTFKKGAEPNSATPVIHHSKNVCDSFRSVGNSIRGVVNFGNSVGQFELVIQFDVAGKVHTEKLSFTVFPTKMDMENDLEIIQQDIDAIYPLWRFSFLQKTAHTLSRSKKPHEEFELLWIAQFKSLSNELAQALKLVCNSPHSRLLKVTKRLKAERLTGKLSPKLEELIKENLNAKNYNKRYRVEKSVLSYNTPENRFVKMVLTHSVNRLTKFTQKVQSIYSSNSTKSKEILSDTFYLKMKELTNPFERLRREPLFKEIGNFEGQLRESLVLHNRAGYSKVYRIWQELKLYLDFFGSDSSISMKSVDKLYEIWCFIEVRRVLIEELGFEDNSQLKTLNTKGLEKELSSSIGKFHFTRKDGVTADLSHEPQFEYKKKEQRISDRIYSWTTTQQPDILLEVTLSDQGKFMWIFDAKYRIDTNGNSNKWPGLGEKFDTIPGDAINQMHRYRDSLLYLSTAREDGSLEKNRPIVGAFALYPGWFNQTENKNPYKESIDEIGIGGFPLLPGRENKWLSEFLLNQIGKYPVDSTYPVNSSDTHYLNEAMRITPYGLSSQRHSNLVLLASVPHGKKPAYKDQFNNGTAKWYHIPVEPKKGLSINKNIIREIHYCAVTVKGDDSRNCVYLYPIIEASIEPRGKIDEFAGGTSKRTDDYWLFKLGEPQKLISPIEREKTVQQFDLRVAQKESVLDAQSWESIDSEYKDIFKDND